jgi:hypothetical protein
MGWACALYFLEDAATLRGTNESVEDMVTTGATFYWT